MHSNEKKDEKLRDHGKLSSNLAAKHSRPHKRGSLICTRNSNLCGSALASSFVQTLQARPASLSVSSNGPHMGASKPALEQLVGEGACGELSAVKSKSLTTN